MESPGPLPLREKFMGFAGIISYSPATVNMSIASEISMPTTSLVTISTVNTIAQMESNN